MAGPLYRQLVRILREGGCSFVRQAKGSHEMWFSPISQRHFAVPYDVQKVSTANAILKQAGLPKSF
jgi:predicted RNA binding protein YcfA (HicA-like mRNA interferase family)